MIVIVAKIVAFIFIMSLNVTVGIALHLLFAARLLMFGPLFEALSMLSGSPPGPKWPINRAAYGWQALVIGTYEKIFRPQQAGSEFDNTFSFFKNIIMFVLFLGAYVASLYVSNLDIFYFFRTWWFITIYIIILVAFMLGHPVEGLLQLIYFGIIMIISIACWPAIFIASFCEYTVGIIFSATGMMAAPNERRLEWARHIPSYALDYVFTLFSDTNKNQQYGLLRDGMSRFAFSSFLYLLIYASMFEVPFQSYFWSFISL